MAIFRNLFGGFLTGRNSRLGQSGVGGMMDAYEAFNRQSQAQNQPDDESLTNYVGGQNPQGVLDQYLSPQMPQAGQPSGYGQYSDTLSALSPGYSKANSLFQTGKALYNGNYQSALNQLSGGRLGQAGLIDSGIAEAGAYGSTAGAGAAEAATDAAAGAYASQAASSAAADEGLIESILAFFL